MYAAHHALPEIFDYMKNSGLKFGDLLQNDFATEGLRDALT
jgi:hypothetical protein